MKFKEKNNYYYFAFIEDIDGNKIEDEITRSNFIWKKKSNFG